MSADRWRLIRHGPLPGALNMAVDQVLLDAVAAGGSLPALRIYRWQPAAVSLGYGQRWEAGVDSACCAARGIDVVRRPTGGRTVLHDQEMTYAVIAPQRSAVFPGGLVANYRVIAQTLQQTLAEFGVAARLAGARSGAKGREGVQRHACFSAPAMAELVCGRHKIAGCAQKRQGSAFLQHGSMPVQMDLELLCRVLGGEGDRARQVRLLGAAVGWVNRFSRRPVSVAELEETFIATFARQLGIDLAVGDLSATEWTQARQLARSRFADPHWRQPAVAG